MDRRTVTTSDLRGPGGYGGASSDVDGRHVADVDAGAGLAGLILPNRGEFPTDVEGATILRECRSTHRPVRVLRAIRSLAHPGCGVGGRSHADGRRRHRKQ